MQGVYLLVGEGLQVEDRWGAEKLAGVMQCFSLRESALAGHTIEFQYSIVVGPKMASR